MKIRFFVLGISILVSIFIFGCASSTPEPTATIIPPTNTTSPTNTPEPTATITLTPTPNATATLAAIATSTVEALLPEIKPALEMAGISIEEGTFAELIKDPISMEVNTYMGSDFTPLSDTSYTDFVLYTEVTWFSFYDQAGCSVAFRAEDNLDKNYYVFKTVRLSTATGWAVQYYNNGNFENDLAFNSYNNDLNLGNGEKNVYLIVVKGKEITIYANGVSIGYFEDTQRLDGGRIIAGVFQQSGGTSCTFSNSWIWNLK